MTGNILFIVIGFLFYLGYKRLKTSKNISTKIPSEIEIKLNSNNYHDFINQVNVGGRVKLWGSPNVKNEIRVYCMGTVGGQGLLSVFSNKVIYNVLTQKKKGVKISLKTQVIQKNNDSLLISIDKVEETISHKDDVLKFIDNLGKKYNPKETTNFRTRFETNIRLTPKKFNKGLKLEFNIDKTEIEKFGNKLMDRKMDYEKSSKWLNTIFWLEYEGERISTQNQTNKVELSKIIRSYLSGYNFSVEIIKDSSDTYLEKELMKYGEKNNFYYSFKVTPKK